MHIDYIDDIAQLTKKIDSVAQNIAAIKQQRALINIPAIKQHFYPEQTTKGWLAIFDELNK